MALHRWCFTENNPANPPTMTDRVRVCHYSKEVGDGGTPHWQGWLIMKKPTKLSYLKTNISYRANWSAMRESVQINYNYCQKQPIGEVVYFPDALAVQKACLNKGNIASIEKRQSALLSAAMYTSKHKHIPFTDAGIRHKRVIEEAIHEREARRMGRRLLIEKYEISNVWRPWQNQVFEALLAQTHRQVLWVYEPNGSVGKSWLAEYLSLAHNYTWLESKTAMHDVAQIIQRKPNGVVIDIPRGCCDEQGYPIVSYDTIERVKNGHLFSTKYGGIDLVIRSPPVVVFSNFYPRRDRLSADRWQIALIVNQRLVFD